MSLSDCTIGPAVAVADMTESRKFYGEQVKLREKESYRDEMTVYECGGDSNLTVYLSPDHAGKASHTQAGWSVSDLEAEMDDLEGRGVRFERYDGTDGPETDDRGILNAEGLRVAWFRDPEGNTFSLNEAT
jgi:predicted enzyme related to lactoylglutathione lyase